MPRGMAFNGEVPDLSKTDTLHTADDIAFGDICVFQRYDAATVVLRLLDPAELNTYPGAIYRLDKLPETGDALFTQLAVPSLEPLNPPLTEPQPTKKRSKTKQKRSAKTE